MKPDHNLLQAALDQALREDFHAFARKAFSVVLPGERFKPNWHFNAIAHALELCLKRRTKRLLITVPPRSGKSILCSVALPAFILGKDPTQRIVCASYGQDLAAKFGRDTRAVMQAPWYGRVFRETRLSSEKQSEGELMTTARGYRLATSVTGPLLGRGGNFMIVDDAMKPEDAVSDAKRTQVTDWFDATLMGRLDDKENGVIVVVMQRLQVEDLAGHVLAKENYVHLNLPAIAEKDEDIPLGHGEVYHRKAGEALHPALASLETLEKTKAEIGTFKFSAQYQQQPVPAEGEVIKWRWFQTYDQEPTRLEHDRIVQSWDTAMTAAAGSDYSVCTTWLVRKNHFYLLDVVRERLDFPALKSRVITQARDWKANSLLIENKGSGQSLIQVLRAAPGAPQPIPIPVHKDKLSRLAGVSDMIEAGQVFLPKSAPWLDEFRSELLQFPNGRYDDQVDSMSQFLNWKRRQTLHATGAPEVKVFDRGSWDDPPPDRDPNIVDLYDDDGANDGYGSY